MQLSNVEHALENLFHHHTKGPAAMPYVEKIKQFVDEHAPELETLLTDAEHAAVAIDPALAPVVGLFGELTDGAKTLAADVIRALHTTAASATPPGPTASTSEASSSAAG